MLWGAAGQARHPYNSMSSHDYVQAILQWLEEIHLNANAIADIYYLQQQTDTAPLQKRRLPVTAMLWRPPARPHARTHARRSPHGLRAVQRPLLAPTNYTLAYLIILSKTIVEEIIQIAELADWTIRVELKMVSAGFRCQCTAEGQSSSSLFIVL